MSEAGDQRPEILAPAGDFSRLEAAVQYGADAVYLAGKNFGMRSSPANFDAEELGRAVAFAHAHGVKVYVTCNTLPRDEQMDALPDFLAQVDDSGADALIVADLGVMALARRHAPRCALHVSTQLGVVNAETARVLYDWGASRVVLARELSIKQIADLRQRAPENLTLEGFVHGAMCVSYSGRCLLSSYLTGRDANQGDCAQPCRWKYTVTEPSRSDRPLTLESAPGEESYLFNAQDLCMIAHLPALYYAGVRSFKIEGRAKSAYYTAVVTHAYRQASEGFAASGFSPDYQPEDWILREVETVSHRAYGTGFYFGSPAQTTHFGGYIRSYEVAAVVEDYADGCLIVSQRNRFWTGETLEMLSPGERPYILPAVRLLTLEGEALENAPHPQMRLKIPCDRPAAPGSFLRRVVGLDPTYPNK